MKVQATIVISYRADSFGDAGGALDDVLERARSREDVEIDSIQLGTPASAETAVERLAGVVRATLEDAEVADRRSSTRA